MRDEEVRDEEVRGNRKKRRRRRSILDVAEDLLAVVVELVQPGHDLDRCQQVHRAEGPAQRRLATTTSHNEPSAHSHRETSQP